jgi:myosin heavy subunit
MLLKSDNPIMKEIGAVLNAEAEVSGARGGKRKAKSVGSVFRQSLGQLMKKISNSDPHYIRCIKPNKEKVPKKFDGPMVMEQLVLGGVLATVQIRQQGFAYRMFHRKFLQSYRCIAGTEKKKAPVTAECLAELTAFVESLPKLLPPESFDGTGLEKNIAIGKSKVFMKLEVFKGLEHARQTALFAKVVTIQSTHRGQMARHSVKQKKEMRAKVVAVLNRVKGGGDASRRPSLGGRRASAWIGDGILCSFKSLETSKELEAELTKVLKEAEALGFRNGDIVEAEKSRDRFQLELGVVKECEDLKTSIDQVAVEKIVARAKGLNLQAFYYVKDLDLEGRLWKLRAQIPLVKAMEAAIEDFKKEHADKDPGTAEGTETEQLKEIVSAIQEVGLGKDSEQWLKETKGKELSEEVRSLLAEWNSKLDAAHRAKEEAEAKSREAAAAAERAKEDAEDSMKSFGPAKSECDKQERIARRVSRKLTNLQREKTVSFAGSAPSEHEQILSGLKRAMEEYDSDGLESKLRRAVDAGLTIESEDTVAEATKFFEKLQEEGFLEQALDEASDEVDNKDAPTYWFKRLENVGQQLEKMPGHEAQAAKAKEKLQQRMVQKAARRSVFQAADPQELDLAARTFADLAESQRLKPVEKWGGHRKSLAIPSGGGTGAMLMHSKVCIVESITKPPAGRDEDMFEGAALQNFRNILVYMGDRAASACQRESSLDAIIGLVRGDPVMRDEVYAQVMKQLTNNKFPRSLQLGWDLFHRLCQEVICVYCIQISRSNWRAC